LPSEWSETSFPTLGLEPDKDELSGLSRAPIARRCPGRTVGP
jgi:hypothetical protein